MMGTLFCRSSVLAAGMILWVVLALADGDAPGSPSQLAKASTAPPPVTFVLDTYADLRLLFCSRSILDRRVKRRVCLVDRAGRDPQEIAVRDGDTVEVV